MTTEGEMFPKDVADRDAETQGLELPEETGGIEGDEQMEAVEVKARRPPREPTEAEWIKHEATHIPYRSWCQQCVRGRGRCKPHHRRTEADPENAVPKVSMDYFFLGSEETEAAESPMFVMVDEEKGNRFARMVDHKGLEEGEAEWLILDAAAEIRSWGHTEGEAMILKCDNEAAIRTVRDALAMYLGGEITPEDPGKRGKAGQRSS